MARLSVWWTRFSFSSSFVYIFFILGSFFYILGQRSITSHSHIIYIVCGGGGGEEKNIFWQFILHRVYNCPDGHPTQNLFKTTTLKPYKTLYHLCQRADRGMSPPPPFIIHPPPFLATPPPFSGDSQPPAVVGVRMSRVYISQIVKIMALKTEIWIWIE